MAKKENGKTTDIIEKLKEIYFMMCEANLKELNINLENYNLRIKRFSSNPDIASKESTSQQMLLVNQDVNENISNNDKMTSVEEIVSPLNGVFYRSPSPGAAPFVEEGDIVSVGSVLCIVEAMKVMNEIKADKNYKIVKVLCENGASVSIGTKLFLVETV
ncbi:MAG: biotin/lipoyl-containing protein [Candidatus Anstonellales archaeon]